MRFWNVLVYDWLDLTPFSNERDVQSNNIGDKADCVKFKCTMTIYSVQKQRHYIKKHAKQIVTNI